MLASALTLHGFTPRTRYIIRDFISPTIIFAFAVFAPLSWLSAVFLVTGQAHFFMAWRGQYRAGKMTRWYLLAAGFLLILAVTYFVTIGTYTPIFLATSLFFAFHFASDELYLHQEPMTPARRFTIVAFTLMFFACVLPGQHFSTVVLGVIFISWVLSRVFFSHERPSKAEIYLWIVGVLFLLPVFFEVGDASRLLAAVILAHCYNWYVDYPQRYGNDAVKIRKYWIDVVKIIVVSAVLYALYIFLSFELLKYAFEFKYYDAWAFAHFWLTLRTTPGELWGQPPSGAVLG